MHTPEEWIQEAARVAAGALCARGKRGAIIVSKDDEIIGKGYNAPPLDDLSLAKCALDLRESSKPKSDRTCCLHAEWRAITDALKNHEDKVMGATIYFAHIDDRGEVLPSGTPYCTVCSRLALDVGLKDFAMQQAQGIHVYSCREFNDISYRFHQST